MNLSIQDGRAELWQWDTGVRLVMDEACEAVNLSEDTFGVTVDVTAAEDGKTWVAAVPDEMLQKPGDLICYAVQSTATGTITAAYRSFRVNRRPKPAGYVATPTEARTWQELDDKKIDAPQTAAVGEVLTVEEVDAEGKPKKWKTAPGIRGDKGDTGPEGPKGADGKDGAGMDVTGAKVGQIAKITAVDSAGKPTEWEPVDMPMQKTLKWITVHSSDLTETKRELIISTDTDGKSIADYNPIGLTLIISTPADATQTDNDGAPWVYPSATKKDNSIRVIGTIAGWKTTARDSVFAFYGGSSAMTCTGNKNAQLATYKIDGYSLDGVTAMLNGNANHFPVGTHVEVAILCEV